MESGLDFNNMPPVDMNVSLDVEDYQTRILDNQNQHSESEIKAEEVNSDEEDIIHAIKKLDGQFDSGAGPKDKIPDERTERFTSR